MPEPHERRALSISTEQLNLLAEQIAEKVSEKAAVKAVNLIKDGIYQEAGKTLLSKLLQLMGVALLGIMYWLNKNGYIQIY